MTKMTEPGARAPAGAPRPNTLYFAVWRWHFYAGIYVIPFLMMLATTGILMIWFTVFAPEFGDRMAVSATGKALSYGELAGRAQDAYPDADIGQFIAPYDATTPALFRMDQNAGARMLAVDPYSGAVLRDTLTSATWEEWATNLHGELLLGANGGWGDLLIEMAASLALLLVVTGLYLAWPRHGQGWKAVFVPNLRAKGRALWKSLHLVSGVWISAVLITFLLSGLAWTGIWGGKYVQAWSSFPAEKWDNVPLSTDAHASLNQGAEESVPWAIAQTPLPLSGSEAGVMGIAEGQAAGLDTVAALARDLGMQGRFQVAYPASETGVWTLSQDSMSYDGSAPTSDRTVHVDQYSGKILADVRYADYSLAGKAMAVGIAFHEGQVGLWNALLNITFCLLILLMSLAGVVMWWKRRPARALRLAAPPRPDMVPLTRGVVLIAVLMSMAFPVLGLTLLGVLAVDLLLLSWMPMLKRALS